MATKYYNIYEDDSIDNSLLSDIDINELTPNQLAKISRLQNISEQKGISQGLTRGALQEAGEVAAGLPAASDLGQVLFENIQRKAAGAPGEYTSGTRSVGGSFSELEETIAGEQETQSITEEPYPYTGDTGGYDVGEMGGGSEDYGDFGFLTEQAFEDALGTLGTQVAVGGLGLTGLGLGAGASLGQSLGLGLGAGITSLLGPVALGYLANQTLGSYMSDRAISDYLSENWGFTQNEISDFQDSISELDPSDMTDFQYALSQAYAAAQEHSQYGFLGRIASWLGFTQSPEDAFEEALNQEYEEMSAAHEDEMSFAPTEDFSEMSTDEDFDEGMSTNYDPGADYGDYGGGYDAGIGGPGDYSDISVDWGDLGDTGDYDIGDTDYGGDWGGWSGDMGWSGSDGWGGYF